MCSTCVCRSLICKLFIIAELFGAQEKTCKTKVATITASSTKRSREDFNETISSSTETTASVTDSSSPSRGLSDGINYSVYSMSSNSTLDYPTLPLPPQHVHPYQYPPPPPPWELPRVPSAHATLPAYLQNFPPPPPPPPPPPSAPPPPPSPCPKFHSVESQTCQDTGGNKSEVPRQGKAFTVYMSKVMIGPQLEEGWVNIQQLNLSIMPKQSPSQLVTLYIFNQEVKTPNL